MSEKKFGLVIPKKTDKFKKRTNVFGDESDEDEKKQKRPKIPQKKIDFKTKIKQDVVEDPSIYEYDSIYDEMKAKEAESMAPKEKKNSRYIETLLKAADKRKKEYERRVDRKIQVEREKEGDLYKDKEAFVTSSYKKKLHEKEEEEERERRENMLNDMMDITKQKDLSGFYRHFLKQTVGEEKVPIFGEKYIKQEIVSSSDDNSPPRDPDFKEDKKIDLANLDQDSDGVEIDSESEGNKSDTSEKKGNKNTADINRYSQGHYKSEEQNQRNKIKKDKSKHSHISKKLKTQYQKSDKDSSSSTESSDNEDIAVDSKSVTNSSKAKNLRKRHDSSSSDENDADKISDKQNVATQKDKGIKSNIYSKRTVEDIFVAAQARYFQRMALKNK